MAEKEKSANWYRRRKLIREQLLKTYTETKESEIALTHQRLANEGRLYTLNYDDRLEPGYIGPKGFEHVPALTWTADQKERFFELLGRKSKAEIDYIAAQINKSPAQCLTYIDLLEKEIAERKLSSTQLEFPEAEEAEPDEPENICIEVSEEEKEKLWGHIDYNDLDIARAARESAREGTKPAKKVLCGLRCLLDCKQIQSQYGVNKAELLLIIRILTAKIREWVSHFVLKTTCGHTIFHDELEIKYMMDRSPDLFYGPVVGSFKSAVEMAWFLELSRPQTGDGTGVDLGTDLGTEMQSSDAETGSAEISTKRAKRRCVRSQESL